jgi:glycosyltransferase involved in cell wall biosynthesis
MDVLGILMDQGVASDIVVDLVVPCYNEEHALPETHRQLAELMDSMIGSGTISRLSRIHYVDDGSRDATWSLISALCQASAAVVGIRLSRNFGHQAALLAGLFTSKADAIISIDADLQDDILVIPQMIERFREGHEVVLGVRKSREIDSVFKRNTALFYYSLIRFLGVNIVPNHADYRLLGRRAISALKEYPEVNLFLRGIVPMLGFNTALVYYDRKERLAGVSKYNLPKMFKLALDGITSFSAVPLRFVSVMGMFVFLLSVGMAGWVFWIRLFTSRAVPGWASSVIPIYFLGGVQLLCLGVIGEYLAKNYIETKQRPRYLIAETKASDDDLRTRPPDAHREMRSIPVNFDQV